MTTTTYHGLEISGTPVPHRPATHTDPESGGYVDDIEIVGVDDWRALLIALDEQNENELLNAVLSDHECTHGECLQESTKRNLLALWEDAMEEALCAQLARDADQDCAANTEPDYEAESVQEQYERAAEEKRRLGG